VTSPSSPRLTRLRPRFVNRAGTKATESCQRARPAQNTPTRVNLRATVIEAAEQVRACVCVCGGKKEEGLLPVFSAERKAEATHAERKKHFSIAAITLFPVPRTPALLHLHSLPQPPVPARRTDPAPLHRIASHASPPGSRPVVASRIAAPRRLSPPVAGTDISRLSCAVVFCFASMEGAGAGPMWWWDCIALDETIDRVRVLVWLGSSFPCCSARSALLLRRVLRSLGVEWNLGELCWPHARRFLLLSLNFVATSIEYLGS
jgi:hypothetical protein